MSTNPYGQSPDDVRKAYEVMTELLDPKVDVRNPNSLLSSGFDPSFILTTGYGWPVRG